MGQTTLEQAKTVLLVSRILSQATKARLIYIISALIFLERQTVDFNKKSTYNPVIHTFLSAVRILLISQTLPQG